MKFPARPLLALAVLTTAWPALAQPRTLTRAIDIRSLSFAEAARGYPVALRGVVVFIEGPSAIFVQDETSTTFFRVHKLPALQVGDEIELRGTTRLGLYLPGIDYAEVKVIGHRALPPGIPARYDDLVFGRYHYQRVTVEGIVRSIAPLDPGKSLIRLAMGSRVMEARVEKPPQPDHLIVDHRVRITGLAAGFVNEWRQLVQPYLRVREWNEIEVLAPAPSAAEVPLVSAEDLLAFRVTGHGEQRVRIEGDVTATFAPTQIFMRNGERGFEVRLVAPTPLQPGDHVTLVGFPEMGRFSASIADAELVQQTAGPEPAPLDIESPDKLGGTHDGNLLRVGGLVRDVFKSEGATTVQLAGKTQSVQVRMPEGVEPPAIGARVQLTGICQVESAAQTASGYTTRPGIVGLRARSAGDIVTVQSPSWWTSRRLAAALGVLATAVLLAGLWIAALRLQVRRQTRALRVRIEAEAALEQRQRIACEFHDTLEQELAGVSLRLDALATRSLDDKGRSLITASRNLVSRIQSETRDLINDLRDSTETAGDLVAALTIVAARHSADSGVPVRVESADPIPPLPPAFVHDLRMLARESVTNAIKHGHATEVTMRVTMKATTLGLQIADNGCGFDPAIADRQRSGHFGCEGIRERARKIGAEVVWHSPPKVGTTVEVTLPLATVRGRMEPAIGAPSSAPQTQVDPGLPLDSSLRTE